MSLQQVAEVPEGPVHRFTLGAAPGVELDLVDLGATVAGLRVTGGDGVRRDVAVTYGDPTDALEATEYLGGTIGRVANRIAGARFALDGREVQVAANEAEQLLHGGPVGFDKRLWRVEEHDERRAVLTLTSPDGDQGFPGTLEVRLEVQVGDDTVDLVLSATTDAPTPVALTSHLYLCLTGADETTAGIRDHDLQVAANRVHLVDDDLVPLPGPARPLDGSPYDLRVPRHLADVVAETDGGLDHDYVLTGEGMREVAWLSAPLSRTRAVLSTDQPDLQVFTGQGLTSHRPYAGLALEPQTPPDSVNRAGADGFPDVTLRPGETYTCRISWRFEALADS